MERKYLLIGFFALIFITLFGSSILEIIKQDENAPLQFLSAIKEAENNPDRPQNLAGYIAKYENIYINYYYRYDNCLAEIESAAEKLDGRIIIKDTDKINVLSKKVSLELSLEKAPELPTAILKGMAQIYDYAGNHIRDQELITIISGPSSCSEKLLLNNICNVLKNQSGVCEQVIVEDENIEGQLIEANDAACYKSCAVKYSNGDKLAVETWQGPPCDRIKGYSLDNNVSFRKCNEDSCQSDREDFGCCKPNECVLLGRCVPPGSTKDVDEDGDYETCSFIENSGVWLNPDSLQAVCNEGKFLWFSCDSYSQCEFGVNNFNKKQKGLCCGDDSGEFAVNCKGKVCTSESDYSCCEEDQCTFNGKCYNSGCTNLETEKGKIKTYCDGQSKSWVDLDDDYCSLCIGDSSAYDTLCCGDDAGEGGRPVPFTYATENDTIETSFFGCVDSKSQCVYPFNPKPFKEGNYLFHEDSQYLHGNYFCDNGKWFDLDISERFCKLSGYQWNTRNGFCCGESQNEFWILGNDSSFGCCPSQNDAVVEGVCQQTMACGNKVIDPGESCELPDTKDNSYCPQIPIQCQDTKTASRDTKGYCTMQCECQQDPIKYECKKDSCGAQCGEDGDCVSGYGCDKSSCTCRLKTFCGDGVIQNINDYFQKEECEPPSDTNSSFCKIEECKDKRSKKSLYLIEPKAQGYGLCKANCKCDYRGFNYTCVKGRCGASCNEDGSGCGEGSACNKESCACYSLFICGNDICEENEQNSCPEDCSLRECPVKIDLEMDSAIYYQNDTMNAQVVVYGQNGDPMPDIRFSFELLVNDVAVGSSTYSTSAGGAYIIKKRVTNFAPRGMHEYIVKTDVHGCQIISDTEHVTVFVNNPYTVTSEEFNLSRYEFIVDAFNLTRSQFTDSKCGDRIIGYGEACEGTGICRPSYGCDYQKKLFDYPENCIMCGCPEDIKSEPNGQEYCNGCKHCGDFEINCGEECENGTINKGTICRNNRMYQKNDVCQSCRWSDNGIISDTLIDTCECDCPNNPAENCANGDYINYTTDYVAGCEEGTCKVCSCIDNYAKDSDKDGIEDKCAQEYCGNKIDDNDNGKVDEDGCIWYFCSQCGYGLFKSCTREDCARYEQKCFFSQGYSSFLGFNRSSGSCSKCSGIRGCEGYKFDFITCSTDPCSFSQCSLTSKGCCADLDFDGVCNKEDNCINATNVDQANFDKDPFGDACDLCPMEANLTKPSSVNESSCSDGIDNDCDGKTDCLDSDCLGTGTCCQNVGDCKQNNCIRESCIEGRCIYEKRKVCDPTECKTGVCDSQGICIGINGSKSACINCAKDRTPNDYGVGYNLSIFSTGCCGDNVNEYYINNGNSTGCCDSLTDCVDSRGECRNSGVAFEDSFCFFGRKQRCDLKYLCAEAGSNYSSYALSKDTSMFCSYDGSRYAFTKSYPKENCNDLIDNDCDRKIDSDDEDC